MSSELVKKALSRAKESKEKEDKKEPDEDAFGDCAKEAWDAMESKDFKAFKSAFKSAVRVAASDED